MVDFFIPYAQTIKQVRQAVQETLDAIFPRFEQPEEVLNYQPSDGGWSIAGILEHITLTTHFLLIVANNGCTKALKRALKQEIDDSESDLGKLEPIGQKGSFTWIRPEHMEPKGHKSTSEILATMLLQRNQCLELLEKLSHGEGSLFKVRMSVNELGKIDLYQWIYFIAQHAKRHLRQMEENLQEWQSLDLTLKTNN